jgi:hypothetical protein
MINVNRQLATTLPRHLEWVAKLIGDVRVQEGDFAAAEIAVQAIIAIEIDSVKEIPEGVHEYFEDYLKSMGCKLIRTVIIPSKPDPRSRNYEFN